MDKNLFTGAGGGGPTTTDDNLKSEDIIEFALAVSEGPIRGLSEGASSFMIGETPLVNVSGTRNFEKFAIGVHPGYPEGSARPLDLKLGGVTSSSTVGVVLLKNVPVTRQVLGALRGTIDQLEVRVLVARLLKVDDEGGTATNEALFTLEYKASQSDTWLPFAPEAKTFTNPINDEIVVIQPKGSEVSIWGKTTSGYTKEFRVNVPRIVSDDWQIRIMKLSPDQDEHDIVDIQWESFQATNKDKLTYPDTAIVHGLGVANGQFSSIPEFSGVYDGLMIRVPTNYNADLRTYDDSIPWDGAFKFSWTNNPAWILYDLITNTRYGLAKHRRYIDANRFTFYEVARWCDIIVPIAGTTETRPRYTYNDVILDSRPAMEMLQYVAGSFNALIWDDLQGQIHLRVDKDDPAVQVFTTENVTDDGFNYTFTDIATRANDVSVTFINPDLDWAEDRRRITGVTTSEEDIEKHGRIPLDFIAVGCTNVHEAVAKAQVRLLSALTETTMVSFATTRQGALLSLYDVILVADPVMGWSVSGRFKSYTDTHVYFRDPIYIEELKDYVMKVQTQTGLINVTVRPAQIGHVYDMQLVGSIMPPNLPRHTVFTLEEEGGLGFGKPFRVLGLEEVEGSPYVYRITAMEINRNKYVLSESGTPITEPDYSYQQPYLPGQPSNFKAESGDDNLLVMPSGEVITRILCTWRKPFGSVIKGYELQWKLASDEAWQAMRLTATDQYLSPVLPGAHYALRVAAIDPQDHLSAWATIADYLVVGKKKIPDNVMSFTATGDVFQILLEWSYGTAPDTKKVELWYSTVANLSSAQKLTDLSYPTTKWTHVGLNIGTVINYWIRVQDTSGNYSEFSSMVTATVSTDPTQILAILTGQITGTQLYHDLATRIDLIDAPASTIDSVAARILEEANARGTAITNLTTVVNTGDEQNASAISALSAVVGDSVAAINNEATVRASQDNALASSIATLATRTGAAEAAISNEATARTNAISAEALARTQQIAQYGADSQAYVQTYTYSKATQDASTNSVYTTLRSEYKAADTALLGSAVAYVQSYAYTKTETNNAIATSVNQVSARLNNVGGSGVTVEQKFTAQASVDAGLSGQYTVKIDSGGRVVGFGLASTVPVTGAPFSSFIIRADSFAIAYPGLTSKIPFAVGLINGVSVVGINGALVIDGSLTVKEANIVNANITTLKIAGEAVTLPRYTNGSGGATVSAGQTSGVVGALVINIAENVSTNFAVIVTWGAASVGGGFGNTGCSVKVDGFEFLRTSYSGIDGNALGYCTTGRVFLGQGNHTFTLQFFNDWSQGTWALQQWSVTIIGTKR